MKRALILTNAYSELPAAAHQHFRLRSEFSLLGVDAEIRRNDLGMYISEGGELCVNGGYDFCVYLDKDKYTAYMLEKAGVKLFNSRLAIELCDDKMLTHIALANRGIPMPKTLAGKLCYTPDAEVKREVIYEAEALLGYPMIVKECYGSLGKGVYKVNNRGQLEEICKKLKCVPHLFQQCVKSSIGRDVRVIVVGGKCAACMERRSDGDFRSNLGLGGHGIPRKSDAELEYICGRTAAALNLDYCGIDVLFGEDGYTVCEVNSNAFFAGIEQVTGVNIARLYVEYICKKVYG